MYLDTHVHVWELARGDYGWISPDNQTLYRDYKPEDVLPELNANDVRQIVLVQAASTVEDTRYMLELADRHAFIAGVVGTLDWSSETFADEYRSLRRHDRFVGVRVNGGTLKDVSEAWLEKARLFAEDGFPMDLLVVPQHLPDVLKLLEYIPDLQVVMNHLGCPLVKGADVTAWREQMGQLAVYEGVHVKISGMITQAGGYNPDKLIPLVEHLVDAFGPERLLFGSDWPVALLGGSYTEVVSLFERVLPDPLTDTQKDLIRHGDAVRIYRLGGRA